MIEFETFLGVMQALQLKMDGPVEPEWLKAIKSPTLGFTHKMQKEMLDHLQAGITKLDDDDVSDLITKLHAPWEVSKNPLQNSQEKTRSKSSC
jgi:hypothetical protein